jgi:hypothetical protein
MLNACYFLFECCKQNSLDILSIFRTQNTSILESTTCQYIYIYMKLFKLSFVFDEHEKKNAGRLRLIIKPLFLCTLLSLAENGVKQ